MAHDPFDLAAQEEAEEAAKLRAIQAEKQEEADLRWLMDGKRGRRVVYRLLERAGVFHLSFNTNAMTMSFNEGRRSEGLALTAKLMRVGIDQFHLMLKENQENG